MHHAFEVREDDGERADDVDEGHDRDHLFGERGDATDAADEDEAGDDEGEDAGDPGRDVEGRVEGAGDRVGLHHVAHEAERDDDRDREEGGERLAAETLADVVGRAAGQVAVSVAGAVELGEDGFGEDGRHAEEGGDPHPEDGARTAHGDGGGHAGEVARAHLGRDGRRERLEGGHAVLVGLAAEERDAAEDVLDGHDEALDLNESKLEGEVQARADEQRNEAVHAPEQAVDALNDLSGLIHGDDSGFCLKSGAVFGRSLSESRPYDSDRGGRMRALGNDPADKRLKNNDSPGPGFSGGTRAFIL